MVQFPEIDSLFWMPIMQVITTHIHADFDGLASMIAAHKFYPDAVLTFPGSQEKNLREFISQNLLYRYDFQKAKAIDQSQISTLIVVDTSSASRLGPFADCIEKPDIEVHLYDHHPGNGSTIKADLEHVENVGSTTTLLVSLLQEKNIPISAEEATIFALGIYEDTGSLTHLSTTPKDLMAAAWLVEQGAHLDTVAQFITHDLTTLQVELLHQLMQNAKRYVIQDIPVIVVTQTLQEYVDDFALIIRHFVNMENIDTLFALISMAGRIYLIARSRIADVNVGNIARDLGGGGHATAASGTIQDMTLIEAEDKLIQTLHRHIKPQPIAKEIMSHPAITIPAHATIDHAKDLLTRYNVTAMPVTSSSATDEYIEHAKAINGIISRMVIEKAIHHNLGHLPVSEYMTTDISTLSMNATLSDIQELIIEKHQRLIPIIHENQLAGVITRTDLLNRLINDPAHLPTEHLNETDYPSLEKTRNLTNVITESLSRQLIDIFRTAGEVAEGLAYDAYAVGGIVRDLLLKKSNLDLDIVVEGDGIHFARALAKELNGKVVTHERFSTAMVVLQDGFKIDVATARLEYYEYPAALPTVELSSIKLDLYRRDFTINAMAIHLNPKQFGNLIDFFNCQNDLKHKVIKVLHNLSFVEDPTRIFRAIRLEQRMGFLISRHTRKLIRSAVDLKLFAKANNPRFFTELQIILSEENPLPAILRMAEFNLYQFLWPDLKPSLKVDDQFNEMLTQAYSAVSWFRLSYLDEKCENWIVYLLTIMARSGLSELKNFCSRFSLTEKTTTSLLGIKKEVDRLVNYFSKDMRVTNSKKYVLFSEIETEGLLYLMAVTTSTDVRMAVSYYFTTLKSMQPLLTGKELIDMGYKPGPQFREILQTLKHARMDELTQTVEDEIRILKKQYPLPRS